MKSLMKIMLLMALMFNSFASDKKIIKALGDLKVDGKPMKSITIEGSKLSIGDGISNQFMFEFDPKNKRMKELMIEILKESDINLLKNLEGKIEAQVLVYDGEEVKLLEAMALLDFLERCGFGWICDDEDDEDDAIEQSDLKRFEIKESQIINKEVVKAVKSNSSLK